MKIRIQVRRHQQFGRLAQRFRDAAAGGLERDAQNELVNAAPPVLAATRGAVLGASFPAAPSDGGSGNAGLRAGLAGATQMQPISNGVRIYVEGDLVGRGAWGHRLAKLTDTELAPRWRHPVHGNRRAWVRQQGQPWFFVTIRAGEPVFRAGVQRAMDRTARKIMS